MNILLLFFALPVATIILSIVLLKILKCPALVAATFFAIYLVLAYTVFGTDFLIFVIIYTILSYITAVLTKLICNIINKVNRCFNNGREGNNQNCCSNLIDTTNANQNGCVYLTSTTANQNGTLSLTNNNSNSNNCNNCNNSNNCARVTLTTNQANPVVVLTNRNNNSSRRNCCCCGRR